MKPFADVIREVFTSHEYNVEQSSSLVLYVYDDSVLKRTFMVCDTTQVLISFVVNNNAKRTVNHICVDGGIVEFGLADYVGDGKKRGRNDCLIFDNNKLLFVELKMNVEETTSDKGRWSRFYDGMNQIADFYIHFRDELQQNGYSLFSYYPLGEIHPIISMKNPPKGSAQRNTLKEKFRQDTNLKIESAVSYTL